MEIEWAATLRSRWLLFNPLHLLFNAGRLWESCAPNLFVYKMLLYTEFTVIQDVQCPIICTLIGVATLQCMKFGQPEKRGWTVGRGNSSSFWRAAGNLSSELNGQNQHLKMNDVLFTSTSKQSMVRNTFAVFTKASAKKHREGINCILCLCLSGRCYIQTLINSGHSNCDVTYTFWSLTWAALVVADLGSYWLHLNVS